MNAKEYNELNELLSEFSKLTALIEGSEAEIKTVQLAAADPLLPKHAAAKISLAGIESRLRRIADAHYDELFPENKKRSHQTPFGGIKYHKSSSLIVEDDEKSILKIKLASEKEMARAIKAGRDPIFTAAQLIRTHEELNLEALEGLDDAALAVFGIKRETKDTFKVLPFDMAADKPAKRSKEKEAA